MEQGVRRRLSSGLRRLERWSATARQAERNAAYQALFAVSEGTVFHTHRVVSDTGRAREFLVVVRADLVIRICLTGPDTFGIVYIGSPSASPDLDLAIGPA